MSLFLGFIERTNAIQVFIESCGFPFAKLIFVGFNMRAFMPLTMTMKLWYKSSGCWRIRSCNKSGNMVILTSCNVGHILEICWHVKHQFGCIVSVRCSGFCGCKEWVFEGKHTQATVVLYWSFSVYSGRGIVRGKRDSTPVSDTTPTTVVQRTVQ